ncbi:hypothetical protein LEMLEM_LOCUS18994 [Lemmus lemmus]
MPTPGKLTKDGSVSLSPCYNVLLSCDPETLYFQEAFGKTSLQLMADQRLTAAAAAEAASAAAAAATTKTISLHRWNQVWSSYRFIVSRCRSYKMITACSPGHRHAG